MTDKLKPCPWCTPDRNDIDINTVGASLVPNYAVQCAFCGCQGPVKNTARKAISAWNKRQGEEDEKTI